MASEKTRQFRLIHPVLLALALLVADMLTGYVIGTTLGSIPGLASSLNEMIGRTKSRFSIALAPPWRVSKRNFLQDREIMFAERMTLDEKGHLYIRVSVRRAWNRRHLNPDELRRKAKRNDLTVQRMPPRFIASSRAQVYRLVQPQNAPDSESAAVNETWVYLVRTPGQVLTILVIGPAGFRDDYPEIETILNSIRLKERSRSPLAPTPRTG